MMRSQRKAAPLIALLAFEVAAIVGLQTLGSYPSMQVPWNELSPWLASGSITDIATPVIRVFALVIAYWMFISTALFAAAQVSRIPSAIRATSMLTLPSVRRVCEGAVAVSLATSSFVGLSGTAASAQTASSVLTDLMAQTELGVVDSPTAAGTQGPEETTTSTSTTTTAAPTTTTSASPRVPVAPSPSDDFVQSPRSTGQGTSSTTSSTTQAPTTTAAPSTTTTTAPSAQTAPSAPAPEVQVMGGQEYRVASGDNLWNISRDALEPGASEAEVRDYWLKVIDENRDNLRSGDPHWIFPGEVIALPAR